MKEENLIKKEAENLLKEIGLEAEAKIEKSDDSYNLFIESNDNALLIGKHGNTLSSFELILSLIIAKKTGEFKRVTVEIDGYRKEREEYLNGLANKLKEEVVSNGSEKSIRGLKPWERRFIHMLFSEDSDVMTESVDEGRDRVLIIKKK